MNAARRIESEARVLGLRLRLGLTDLAAVERWADHAILEDGGAHAELADLCLARSAGETVSAARLGVMGGETTALDLMRAISIVKVEAQSLDELRRLADNLDPLLREADEKSGLPDMLKPALAFAGDFWRARVYGGEGAMERAAQNMRDLLHEVKEYAAELPEETAAALKAAEQDLSVSALVVSYRTGDVLFDCLRALLDEPAIVEVVLIDNGVPQETLWQVDERFGASGRLKVVGGGVNRGFAAGVNLGAASARGGRLLIVNPDAIVQAGSVAALEAARSGQTEPVVVGGKIFGTDGREQRGARRRRLTMQSAAVTFLGLGWLRRFNPAFVSINCNDEPEPSCPVAVDAVSGAFMYLSRTGFDRLGGFDEGYFLHVEDIDLCRRAEAEGGSVIYAPMARALHHGGTSDAPSFAVERHKAAGLARYFRKFAESPAERTAAKLLGPLITLALLLRARVRRR